MSKKRATKPQYVPGPLDMKEARANLEIEGAQPALDALQSGSFEVKSIVCPKCGANCHLPPRTLTEFVTMSGMNFVAAMKIANVIKESIAQGFKELRAQPAETKEQSAGQVTDDGA